MNRFASISNYWLHLPRAIVAFTGLYVFHVLSGDALASWSMMGIAALALIARTTGSLKNRRTRIELSIASTACVLVFLQGGFIDHFNSLSLPLVLSIVMLLVGLNAMNLSIPQARIGVVPILCVLFFVSQRYFYPSLASEFANPLLTIGLLAAAWELLSSLIHAKRASPSIVETGVTITLLFLYYQQSADFPIVAFLSMGVLFAYFFGASQLGEDSVAPNFTFQSQGDSLHHREALKSYAFLFLVGLVLFSITAWLLNTRLSDLPVLASLDAPKKPLKIEQRNRLEQAFLSFENPDTHVPKPLEPLNISILKEALQRTAQAETSQNRRKVTIRKTRDLKGFNVSDREDEKIQRTRISKIPSLRISPVKSSQSLPEYNLTAEADSSESQESSNAFKYDFGFGSDSPNAAGEEKQGENLAMGSEGNPLRINQLPPSVANEPTPTSPRHRNNRPTASPKTLPRDLQFSVGFSPHLQFANNVSTELKTRPIMEVFVPGSAKWISSLYLRFNTLEEIESDRFVQAKVSTGPAPILSQPGWNEAPLALRSEEESEEPWTIALGYDLNDWIPLLGPFESIKIPTGHSFVANEATFTMRRVSGSGPFAYQFRGPQITDTWTLTNQGISDSERERLTRLPLSSKEISYLKRLGTRIAGKNPSAANFARKAGYYFSDTHPYAFDFNFRAGEGNLLVSWLKARSPGICGYYAGAFTLLARARGIPTRVVIGALTREFDSRSRKFIVRDRDAHAWAEYLNEKNEWVRADPTPIALDSPRFTTSESNSEVYANNIQSALASLNDRIEAFERPAIQDPLGSDESLKTPIESDKSSGTPALSEIVPSTAALVDKVMEREATRATEILETTSALAAEVSDLPEDEIPPPLEAADQPVRETVETISVKQVTDSNVAEAVVPEITVATVPVLQSESWILSPRVVINYLFIILLAAFAYSQLARTRKIITERGTLPESPIQRERSLAGRLLSEIDSLGSRRPEADEALQNLRQRALQLRYSPHCSLSEIKSLQRDLRQSIAHLKPVR